MKLRSGLATLFFTCFFVPLALADNKKSSSVCRSLSLFESKGTSPSQDDTHKLTATLKVFEQAFLEKSVSKFQSILHPSLVKSKGTQQEVFESTIQSFGLEQSKLVPIEMYEITFEETQSSLEVDCSGGKIRGVVGPRKQWAVFYSAITKGAGEQVRIMSLFAEVPKSLASLHHYSNDIGLVMLQGQSWSHAHKTPQSIFAEAKHWSSVDEPLAAFVLAEAARRILTANPYFSPTDVEKVSKETQLIAEHLPSAQKINSVLQKANINWQFLSFTPVFQAKGIELGIKFRVPGTVELKDQMNICRQGLKSIMASSSAGLRSSFRGVECLPFAPKDDLQKPSSLGSQFLTWQEIFN